MNRRDFCYGPSRTVGDPNNVQSSWIFPIMCIQVEIETKRVVDGPNHVQSMVRRDL